MDPFSLGVGSVAILDECLKCGKVLVKLYDDYRAAETKVSEVLFKLRVLWYKIKTQMEFLQKIWDDADSEYQRNQLLLLSILKNKLQEAVHLLNRIIGGNPEPDDLSRIVTKKGPLKKVEYAVWVKKRLEKLLSEFIEWQNLFDTSWYLLARSPNSEIDRKLESDPKSEAISLLKGLRKSVRDLNSEASMPSRAISSNDFLGPRTSIIASCAAIAQFEGNCRHAVVDTMLVSSSMDTAETARSVISLSRALSRMDPMTFGLLRCCGVINKTEKYDFVFEIPQGLHAPRSLRDLLANYQPSLNLKLDVAKQLAKSVLYLHTIGFVHKNIRPETILIFESGEAKSSFLVGFEKFRAAKDDTLYISDSLPERELYRHPSRQGNNPERKYIMQHDIYSLGVCLLEIGLWKSFIEVNKNKTIFDFDQDIPGKDQRKRAFAIKKQLLVTTDSQLAQLTGRRFKDIVEKCLTCLDDDSTWSQTDEKEASQIGVGVDFIENVLLQLQEIVV